MFFLILGVAMAAIGIYLITSSSLFAIAGYTLAGVGGMFILMGLFFKGAGKRQARLMTTGIDAIATVKAAQQTNVEINNQPMVSLTLEITPPTSTPFTVTMKTAVPIIVLSQVRLVPGAQLPVKLDPAKPTSFIINWGAAVQMQGAAAQVPVGTPAT